MSNQPTLRDAMRRAIALGAAAALLAIGAGPVAAQDSPITLIVAFPPGGGVDRAARVMSEKLSHELGRTIVVDNRPGAGGQIAARLLKQSATDGSVLLITNSHPMVVVPHTVRKPGYEPLVDFKPVANFVNFETILASTGEAKTFQALAAAAKQKKDMLNIGVPAPASLPEFMADAVGRTLDVKVQAVAYKGAAPLLQDLLGHQIEIGVLTMTEAITYAPSGKMSVLAVSRKSAQLPGVPSFAEVGLKGLDGTDFIGVFAPAAMSDALAERYAAAIKRVGAMPDVIEKVRAQGQDIDTVAGAAFADRIRRMSQSSAELVRISGFKPE